jgi:hypothetical protein
MRNPELDKVLEIDSKIGEPFIENGKLYRMVDGKKIHQIPENTQADIDFNLICNRYRITEKI